MKKRINWRKKNNIKYFVIIIFILFVSLSLSLFNRKEFIVETFFKSMTSKINSYFISKLYANNKLSDSFNATRYNSMQEENNQLRSILDLEKNSTSFIAAEVTIQNSRSWFDKIYINKGTNNNIREGLVVVNNEGAIGFVNKSYNNISEVSLLTGTYSDNLVSVIIETDLGNISGIITSYDVNKKMYVVSDITTKDNIPPGSKVLLYGYNDERINGILVGYVAKEETDSYGLSKRVWVKTNVDFNNLMFVSVMVNK